MNPPLLLTCFERTAKWMRRGGRENDIILSSRIRLARNLHPFAFPHRAENEELLTIRHRIWTALHSANNALPNARLLSFEEFNTWERQSLIDRHLTSREHIGEEWGRGLAASADASLCALVNEEDHLRIQSLLPGLQLDEAHRLADKLDDALESYFDARGGFAFHDDFGYLAACPTNAGTGMRAGVMLHLPALEIVGKIEKSRKWAEEKGMTLRGTFGEGTKIWGHLHQLSNGRALGADETQIILETQSAAQELCEMERAARAALETEKWREDARDRIGRAFGVLRYARKIGCREATDYLSMLRLAHELNWAKGLTRQRFNELLVWIRPSYMQVLHSRAIEAAERDTMRAELLRSHVARVRLDPSFSEVTYPTSRTETKLAPENLPS